MKLIIAGKRDFYLGINMIESLCEHFKIKPSEIVCGCANGVDETGKSWAFNKNIPVRFFKPDWGKLGLAAGPLRNKEMANYADALLLIWDGQSRGSNSMKSEMSRVNKPIFEVILK